MSLAYYLLPILLIELLQGCYSSKIDTMAAQIAWLEPGAGNTTRWKKMKEKLQIVLIFFVLSNVVYSCPAKTLAIKGRQVKRALLHIWQGRALGP